MKRVIVIVCLATIILLLGSVLYAGNSLETHNNNGKSLEKKIGEKLPLWSIIPFAGILLSIAIFPLVKPHFWHKHYGKIAAFWALVFFIPFFLIYPQDAIFEGLHIILLDYIPFIILLWALFTAAGGILIKGTLKGTPGINFLMILIGTLMSSFIGTTGSAMVLIRPVIRANKHRRYKTHIIVFFIFLVANIGGSLTPLGDPPLFLGFLHGVPFFWTLNIFPHMGFICLILLLIFFMLDYYFYRKETEEAKVEMNNVEKEPIKIHGLINFLFLAGIMGGVLLSGVWHPGEINLMGCHVGLENIVRNVILIIMGLLSLKFTKNEYREGNEFSWGPIKEVGYLFAGIFITIIPAIAILKAGEKGALGFLMSAVKEPVHYFWVTGVLSSFLDNAPTYLTFFNSALGNFVLTNPEFLAKFPGGCTEFQSVNYLIQHKEIILKAISTGAVFMGANTYIGNAPNFMVKAIAEENNIKMPSFFGYMVKYSIPILFTSFVLVTLLFFI